MDVQSLEKKLNSIKQNLSTDESLKNISEKIKNNQYSDNETKYEAKQEYYSHLPPHEKLYQQKNDDYKELINQFSQSYLELSDFYVGSELPREHYLQSRKDVAELYLMFAFYAFAEPYINAYHNKFG
jgi:hypothetical protein